MKNKKGSLMTWFWIILFLSIMTSAIRSSYYRQTTYNDQYEDMLREQQQELQDQYEDLREQQMEEMEKELQEEDYREQLMEESKKYLMENALQDQYESIFREQEEY